MALMLLFVERTYPRESKPSRVSRNSAGIISSVRSMRNLPIIWFPLKPSVFRMVISPPSKLISRRIDALCSGITPLSRGSMRQPSGGVFLQPIPQLLEAHTDFTLDPGKVGGAQLPAVWAALSEKVIFDLWLRARTSHRDARSILQFEDQHFLLRD